MKKLLIGNAAVARGAYEAGVRLVSSYPGTPSTEITEELAKYDEVFSEWAPNEKVAAEVAMGASIGGARAMCCMKHVGFNVAADPMYTASYTGINGGMVLCVADDPGMHSSQNEQDSRNHAIGSKLPMLEPADSSECKEFTKLAFALSEEYDTPILMRLHTRVAHSQSLVEICEREEVPIREYKKDPIKYVMMPAMAIKKHPQVEARTRALVDFADKGCPFNRVEDNGGEVGFITSGAAYYYVKEAFPESSVLKLGLVNPLPEKLIVDFAKKFKKVYVVEELDPVIENHCKQLGLDVIGKDVFPMCGELSGELVRKLVSGKGTEIVAAAEEAVPGRPPVMCAGCPHRGMYYVLKKLGLRVNGDIGCYTLGALAPLQSLDTSLCMGASIGMSHGMEKALGREATKKTVSVIGDSTFIHSGITGLIDIVYNKGNSTVIILDNSITGMTGHQENPATGRTIKGEPTYELDLADLAKAVGVKRVEICDPFDLDKFEKIVKKEIEADEPSVIISQRPCALLKSVKYTGHMVVNQDKCKKCKMCLGLGCPAISWKEDHVEVDKNQCNGCGLCQNLCKFGAFEKVE